jgi:hypothetical protein
MSYHSGTTNCRSDNIPYTFRNMYLIFRVTSMQQIIQYNISEKEHIYQHNCWLQQNEPLTCLSVLGFNITLL